MVTRASARKTTRHPNGNPNDRVLGDYPEPRTRSNGSGKSIGPDDEDGQPKGSAIYRIKIFVENLFSYRSMFFLGIGIALIAFGFNVLFYFGLFSDVVGLEFFLAIPAALILSFGTSLFQLMPELQTATARMSLHQLFVAGTKPKVIPVIDPSVVADSKNLIADYRQTEVKRRQFFKMARLLSFVVEVFLGIMFIGNIGAGVGAAFSLIGFALSVWGVEAGVKLALKAGEDALPPQVQAQLKGLLENNGKDLQLRGV